MAQWFGSPTLSIIYETTKSNIENIVNLKTWRDV